MYVSTPLLAVRLSIDKLRARRNLTGGHTNTERGYLPTLARRLSEELASVASEVEGKAEGDTTGASVLRALRVDVSTKDKHPLAVV